MYRFAPCCTISNVDQHLLNLNKLLSIESEVTVDLADAVIDSSTIAALIILLVRAKSINTKLKLINPTQQLMALCTLYGVANIFAFDE